MVTEGLITGYSIYLGEFLSVCPEVDKFPGEIKLHFQHGGVWMNFASVARLRKALEHPITKKEVEHHAKWASTAGVESAPAETPIPPVSTDTGQAPEV